MQITHSFDPRDAEALGVEKAIILYQLRLWLSKDIAVAEAIPKSINVREHTN